MTNADAYSKFKNDLPDVIQSTIHGYAFGPSHRLLLYIRDAERQICVLDRNRCCWTLCTNCKIRVSLDTLELTGPTPNYESSSIGLV